MTMKKWAIDFDSLILIQWLIFRVVVENYQDYLIHKEIPPANWELAQMNSRCSKWITCDMSFITISRTRMMSVSWKLLLSIIVISVSCFVCHFMIIEKQSNQSHIINPKAERILEDRLYREEIEYLIAQELPLPLIDRHIPERKLGLDNFRKKWTIVSFRNSCLYRDRFFYT